MGPAHFGIDDGDAWPSDDFGFVWGCYWGDEALWQLYYIDLSRVQHGMLAHDQRFGRIELAFATGGYATPCISDALGPIAKTKSAQPPFVRISRSGGVACVVFDVEIAFDLASGKSKVWQQVSSPEDE